LTEIRVSKLVRGHLEAIRWYEGHESFDDVILNLIDKTYTPEEWNKILEEYTEAHIDELEEKRAIKEEEELVDFGEGMDDEIVGWPEEEEF
jgi:predicted CopG family antitoxin